MIIKKKLDNYQGSRREMVYRQDQFQAIPYQDKVIGKKRKPKKKKSSKIFVRPIIIGMIGSSNYIGTRLNG